MSSTSTKMINKAGIASTLMVSASAGEWSLGGNDYWDEDQCVDLKYILKHHTIGLTMDSVVWIKKI